MTKLERVIKEVSDLRNFYLKIKMVMKPIKATKKKVLKSFKQK